MKCIIVDSQPQAVQVLKNYIKKIPFLEFTGSFADPREAGVFLKNNAVDLIFLDIKKSPQAGSPSYNIFKLPSMVILTSSNRKFAYDAFENRAVDFLVKPLLFERLYVAAEKAYKLSYPIENTNLLKGQPNLKGGYVFIKEGTRLLRLELDDIYYIMGLKNYVSIIMKSQRIVSLMTMKEIEELLPPHRFIRVHRSYFVALDKIVSVEKQQIHIKDKVIPIGNIYLPLFMKKLLKNTSK
jgi:DNA-binding LytR/AlgR family response regulator